MAEASITVAEASMTDDSTAAEGLTLVAGP